MSSRIENIVASSRLAEHVDVPALAQAIASAQYAPDKSDALILKRQGATALVFPDGRVMVTGPRSHAGAEATIRAIGAELAAAGVAVHGSFDLVPENVVVTSHLGQDVRLQEVAIALEDLEVAFDPETFPGIIARARGTSTTVLCFASGVTVATNTNDADEATRALESFAGQLRDKGVVA